MNPRQARRERREAERKAKKLELKKSRLAEKHPLAAVDEFPEIQPRWNPELEDEFPREVQIRNNAQMDLLALKAGLPIPPPGPSPVLKTPDDIPEHLLARRKAAGKLDLPANTIDPGFVSQTPAAPIQPPPDTDIGFVSQPKRSRAEINRANAQNSTGPTSPIGKLASSRNSFKHGLASGQLIIPGEDPALFDSFLNDLLEEHQPASLTEELLIKEMAQSHWLHQRAIRLQNSCFTGEGVDQTGEGVDQKGLALFLRYGATHHRAFYKALGDLQRLQKDRRKVQPGFVSHHPLHTATPASGFVSQTAAQTSSSEQFVPQNDPSTSFDNGFVSQPQQIESTEKNKGAQKAA